MQAYDSIMWGYFCIGFIDFMLQDKRLLEYANLFSRDDYEKNDEKNNSKISSITEKIKKLCCVIYSEYRKFEKPKLLYLLDS